MANENYENAYSDDSFWDKVKNYAKAAGEASWLEDEGAIPEQYVDRVAEYFRLLAEEPAKP